MRGCAQRKEIVNIGDIRDIFACDMARVDLLGTNARFLFTTNEFPREGAAPVHRAGCSLILPQTAIIPAINLTLFSLGMKGLDMLAEWSRWPH
jgi:hypothetical protein